MPADPSIAVPELLRAAYTSWRWTAASAYPRQMTWRLDCDRATHYLKVGVAGEYPGLLAEARRTRWAAPFLSVAPVIDHGSDGTVALLVTAAITGRPATDPTLGRPADVVVALAEGLRRFHHHAPIDHCPFAFHLDHALEHVRRRVAAGSVDPGAEFHDEHCYLRTATAALDELERLCPDREDVVVCHGDYCSPNVLLDGGQVVGYVDLGELAAADRWWDLAVGTWSTTWNFGPGLESLFLSAYGARPDPDRQAFYRLLFDLAS